MAGANDARQRKNIPKRAMNAARKAKMARSWARRQERKAANISANRAAFLANEEYRKRGELTPYEARRAAYYANR